MLAVKWVEELARKEKLWKIEMTVPTKYRAAVDFDLREVPHSYIEISDKHTLFNFYCATQAESKKVKDIVAQYGAKYFVAESKNELPAFKLRIDNGKVFQHDRIDASSTVLKENETFGFSHIIYDNDYAVFQDSVKQEIARVQQTDTLLTTANSGVTA